MVVQLNKHWITGRSYYGTWDKDEKGKRVFNITHGVTAYALTALEDCLSNEDIERVQRIVSQGSDTPGIGYSVFTKMGMEIVIPNGFAKGYSGEGPRGYKKAEKLLSERNVPIKEKQLSEKEFKLFFNPP